MDSAPEENDDTVLIPNSRQELQEAIIEWQAELGRKEIHDVGVDITLEDDDGNKERLEICPTIEALQYLDEGAQYASSSDEEIEVCPAIDALQYLDGAAQNGSSCESKGEEESRANEVYIKQEPSDSYLTEDSPLGVHDVAVANTHEEDDGNGEKIEVCPSIESLQYLDETAQNGSSSGVHDENAHEEDVETDDGRGEEIEVCPSIESLQNVDEAAHNGPSGPSTEAEIEHQSASNDHINQSSVSATADSSFSFEDSHVDEGSSGVSECSLPNNATPMNSRKRKVASEKPKRVREKKYVCSVCPYKSAHHSNLRSHVMSKHSLERPYSCTYCDYSTVSNSTLKRHIMYKHTKERSFQCPYCSYTAAQNSSIKSHVMHKHTNEKRFSCSFCEFSSVTSSNLKTHIMAKHSGERPLSCPYCPYSAASSNGLNSHIAYNHTKEKPFTCPHCEYSAVAKTALKRHIMYNHTKEKPFQCPFCDYSAVTSSHIRRHINRKHYEELPN